MLEKTLYSPLDSKEIQPVHPKGNQSWIFIGRTDAEAETPILWPYDANWFIWKDPDAGENDRPEEKGRTEYELVMPSNHLILCCPLLLPSLFPSIRVFSSESALCIRWPKYWSFSTSPSNEYSGLISFRIDWFDLAVQRTLKSLLQHHNMKVSWAFKVVGSSRTSPLQLLAISYL